MQSTASSAGYSTGGRWFRRSRPICCLNPEPLPMPLHAGMGLLPGGPGRDDGDSHEAADDQHRATPLPQRNCRGGNAAGAAFARGERHARRPGAGHRRHPGRRQPVLEGRVWARSRLGTWRTYSLDALRRSNKVNKPCSARHGWIARYLRLGPDFHCGGGADGHAGVGQHALGRHLVLGRVRSDPATPRDYRRTRDTKRSCSGPCGAAFPA